MDKIGKRYSLDIGKNMACDVTELDIAGAAKNVKSGDGLENINKRLKYAYGTELNFQSSDGVGTKVTIRIPLEQA